MKSFKLALALTVSTFTTAFAADTEPQLDGYCPVCYVSAGKAVKGTKEFAATHKDQTYYFVNVDAMKAFQAEPTKFLPQYDGFCAYGMSLGKKFESDPTVFSVINGKIYLNKDASIGKLFAKNTQSHIAKADAAWKPMAMAAEKEMAMKKEAMMKKEEMMKKEKMKK